MRGALLLPTGVIIIFSGGSIVLEENLGLPVLEQGHPAMQVSELAFRRLLKFMDFSPEARNIFALSLFILDYPVLQRFCALCQLCKLILQELLVLTRFELNINDLLREFADLALDSFELLLTTALVIGDFHFGLFHQGLIHVAVI